MPDRSDHDRIIRVEGKVETLESNFIYLTDKIDKLTTSIESHHEALLVKLDEKLDKSSDACNMCKSDIYDKLDDINDTKVPWPTFKWIFGGSLSVIMACMIFIGGMSWDTRQYLERHIIFSEMIFYQVTGQQWDDAARETLLEARDEWENFKNGERDLYPLPGDDDDENTLLEDPLK